jgi:hypothetical protein
MKEIEEIREVLRKFQEGYIKRDLNRINDFMEELFASGEDTIVFGAAPYEECFGYEEAKKLIETDWKFWGDFSIDIDGAVISCSESMASLTTRGKVKMQIPTNNLCNRSLQDIEQIIKNDLPPKGKLLLVNDNASKVLLELERGETHIWPIRLSAALIKRNNKWLFKQMHCSHPVSAYPGQRIIE